LIMDVNKQSGQALVELILFLPFMIMTYTVVMSLGDAIFASINQQKVTRAYFFYRLQNNSQISKPMRASDGGPLINANWDTFGHFFVGWSDYLNSDQPVAPCFRLNLPFAPSAADTCESSYTNLSTQFIRVATVFGICGATLAQESGQYVEMPVGAAAAPGNGAQALSLVLSEGSCLIR
jgi:hypothetical protein